MLQLRFSAAALAVSLAFAAAPAAAGISDCGNINVQGKAQCEAKFETECLAECTPPKLQAACAAKLEIDCQTKCTDLPSVSCTGSCKGDCEAECDVEPAKFDCEANCNATCTGDCSGKCSAADDSAECEAQCKATCGGECSANCTVKPGSADCKAKCEASCTGSCTADANFECQTKCQGEGFVDCQAEFQKGKCEVQCMDPEGAVFCDGQFVDSGGNAQKCLKAIDDYIQAHFHVEASGSSSCQKNTCEAEGKVNCHCSTPARRAGSLPAGLAFLGALGLIGVARMRRR